MSEGDWVIDTKKNIAVTLAAVLEIGIKTLYILETDESEFYISDDSNIIPYNKYYFDREEEKE